MTKNLKSETIVFISFISIFVLTILLSYLVTHVSLIKSFDLYFYKQISSIPRNYYLDLLVFPINKNFIPLGPANFPIFIVFIVGMFLIYMYFKHSKMFYSALITVIVGGIFVSLQYMFNSEFIFRARPFINNSPLYLDELTKKQLQIWTSFPSGHTRETTLFLTIIAHYLPKLKISALIFCLFIAFSRVYLGVHFPTDVLAGLLIGFLSAQISIHAVKVIKKVFKLKI